MRTIPSAAQDQITSPSGRTQAVRVRVKDAGDTWRDLRTYVDGLDVIVAASWRESVDEPGWEADLEVRRNQEGFSINPLMEDSALNRGFSPLNAYAPLLGLGREIEVYWQILWPDQAIDEGAWQLGFQGRIDDFDVAADPMPIHARGRHGRVQDRFIEYDRMHNFAQPGPGGTPDRGCRIFRRNTLFALNTLVVPTQAKMNGYVYKVTTAGTTGDGEPTWPTTLTNTVASGTVVFTCQFTGDADTGTALESTIAHLLTDNMGADAPAVYTPTSPSWMIRAYTQERCALLEAPRALVDQIGWDFRDKWDNGTSQFRFTLWSPDRAKVTPDWTFGQYDGPGEKQVRKLELSIADIRTVVRVVVSDSADIAPDGQARRKTIEIEDAAAIAEYGRRFCEIAEGDTSNLDTIAEAEDLAEKILSDLSSPFASFEIDVPFFPWAEIGDLYEFPPNDVHFSTSQTLAVVGVTHGIDSKGSGVTSLQLRGSVCGGFKKWLGKDVRAGSGDVHALDLVTAPWVTVDITDVIGGNRIRTDIEPLPGARDMMFEHYFGDDPAFEPEAANLVTVSASRDLTITDQVPGAEKYYKTVPVWFNGTRKVRGEPSAAQLITAGRGFAGHLKSEVNWGRFPLNGGFETQFDPTAPPDHWEMIYGTWGTDITVTSNARSGERAIEFQLGTSARGLATGFFDVAEGDEYEVEALIYPISGAGLCLVTIEWYDANKVAVFPPAPGLGVAQDMDLDVGTWVRLTNSGAAPQYARFGRIIITKDSARATIECRVDGVRVSRTGTLTSGGTISSVWHAVDAVDEPPFENNFGNVGGEAQLEFRRVDDEVQFQGSATSSSDLPNDGDESNDAATVLTLAADFCPPFKRRFIVSSSGLPAHVVVLPTGEVRVPFGQKEAISFDQVRYFVEAATGGEASDLLSGIIAYWALEADSDDAIGVCDGTDTGITYAAAKVSNGATGLNGSGDKIVLPSNHSAIMPTTGLTISAWVYPTAVGENRIISCGWENYPTALSGFVINLDSSSRASFAVANNTGYTPNTHFGSLLSAGSSVPINTWTHIVATWDGATMKLYINGGAPVTQAWSSGLAYHGTTVRASIGYALVTVFGGDQHRYFTGNLDEVGLWNRALTATEVAALYNDGDGISYPF